MHEVPTDPAPTALLFPGQGSQTAEMREQVERACPHLLEQAIDELGVDPFEHVDDGTAFAQPALYCASLAGWNAAHRPPAAFMAGHSLGELAALVAAAASTSRTGCRSQSPAAASCRTQPRAALREACSRRSGTGSRHSGSPTASV
jgi:malonyl CoA-acyl carrier protein transacylase